MDKTYIGVNLPNLVSVAIMVGVIATVYCGIRRLGKPSPLSIEAAP